MKNAAPRLPIACVWALCTTLLLQPAAAAGQQETSVWRGAKMSDREIKERLTPEQYRVTQENGTERPFENEFWNNHREGIYVDVVSGEPLFASIHKFDSGTGWPSFFRPLVEENIVEKRDRSWFVVRTEVRSSHADSHLGHVFDDGPPPTGLRYCVNSAALSFVPVEELEEKGYAEFLPLFEGKTPDDHD